MGEYSVAIGAMLSIIYSHLHGIAKNIFNPKSSDFGYP